MLAASRRLKLSRSPVEAAFSLCFSRLLGAAASNHNEMSGSGVARQKVKGKERTIGVEHGHIVDSWTLLANAFSPRGSGTQYITT